MVLVKLLKETDRAAFISYSTMASLDLGLTYMDADGKDTLNSTIDGLTASGYTSMREALELAVDELDTNSRLGSRKMIILLTDGQPWQSDWTEEDAAAEKELILSEPVSNSTFRGYVIHTIGLGVPGDAPYGLDPVFLNSTAVSTRGEYYETPDPEDLEGIFIEIAPSSDSDQATFSVVPNLPPVLDPINAQIVDEGALLSFTVSATDPDLPANTLTLSVSNLPEGATFDPATGVFSWTPSEAQGPGSYDVTFTVTDDGVPPLSDAEVVTVTVNEVNLPPVLDPINAQIVDEGALLSFTVSATDPDLPANTLTLSVSNLLEGATFDPATGVFSWTPDYDQAGSYIVSFQTDDGRGKMDSKDISLTVTETSNPVIIMSPAEGYGDTTIYGQGFVPNSVITLTWDDHDITTAPQIIITNGDGKFTAIINRLPQEMTPSTYIVKAVDEWGNWDDATFTILEAPQGEIGSTGESGQAISPGYFGMLLLVMATSFLVSFKTSRIQKEDKEDSETI
jgi:hypothetical protein